MNAKSKKSSKREMILERAQDIFSTHGYEKTTLDDIGNSCGLNKASLYYYFRNKEEIYVQVILQEAAGFIKLHQETVRNFESTEDKVYNYLLGRIRSYAKAINLSQLSLESVQKVEPMFQELFKKIKNEEIEFLKALLEDGIAKGDIEKVNSSELAEALFVISDALKHERMLKEKPYHRGLYNYTKVEDLLGLMIRLLFKGLKLTETGLHLK